MRKSDEQGDSYYVSLFREFLSAMDIMVGVTGRFLRIPTGDQPPFWIVAYDSVPSEGSTTAFTFGVSLVPNDLWQFGRPELVVSINSVDDDWLLSLGAISAGLRGRCPFSLGNVLRFGKPLSEESKMSAFFLFWPTILEKDQLQLQLSDRKINFAQAYPIFESEGDLVAKIGAEKFFMTEDLEFADIKRKDYSLRNA